MFILCTSHLRRQSVAVDLFALSCGSVSQTNVIKRDIQIKKGCDVMSYIHPFADAKNDMYY